MSLERAREFLEAAGANPALRERLERAKTEDTGEAAREAMRAAGFGDVTGDDLTAVLGMDAGHRPEGELADEQLNEVQGGAFMGFHSWPEAVMVVGCWIAKKLD
jgi:predicted ribosomally synthesized peptide with nif11-like leader